MNPDPKAGFLQHTQRARTLTKVLEENEQVKELVKESARQLSWVNTVIKQALANLGPLSELEQAIKKSDSVQRTVQEALEKLTVVNLALEGEVRERDMVDHQMAAAIEQEEGARYAALHDVLTGLPNRALFNDRLEHGIAQAKRHGWTLAMMFVDLDQFKRINDTYGHDAGDFVLRTTAQRLKESTRSDDTVCRQGGDEFLYLLTQIHDEKDIAMIAEKVIQTIQIPCNVRIHDLNINPSIRASIGISLFPKHGTTADMLIRRADEAMYRAKQNKCRYLFAQ